MAWFLSRLRGVVVALPTGFWPSVWVVAIVSTLLSLVVGMGFLSVNQDRFLPPFKKPQYSESVIEYDMQYILNSEEYNDVIFVGGSGALAALVTNSFQEKTGLRAYNLGTVNLIGPDGQLEMVRAYLNNHPKPQAVVNLAFPGDLVDTSTSDPELRDRFLRAYGVELKSGGLSRFEQAKNYVQEGRLIVKRLVSNRLKDPYYIGRGSRPTHNAMGPQMVESRGFVPYPQEEFEFVDVDYLEFIDAFIVTDWYDRNLRDMARHVQVQGVEFVLFIMPVPQYDKEIDEDPLALWASEFLDDFPDATVKGLPLERYEGSLWGNPAHLNQGGAELFTGSVSRELGSLLSGSTAGK